MGSYRVVWVWPEMIRSMPSTCPASCSSSEFFFFSSVPPWDRQMMNWAPCSRRLSTQRWALSARSSSTKPEVGAQSWESSPMSPKIP